MSDRGEEITCDDCGDLTSAWDYAPDYSLLCPKCLAKAEDDDPRADRGDWRVHQERDQ